MSNERSQFAGRAIHALRDEAGWSMDELASRIGATISTVNRIEKGGTDLISHWVEKLAEAFGLSERALVDRLLPPEACGFGEPGARPYEHDDAPALAHASFGPNQEKWTIVNDDLSAIGLARGDVVVVDFSQEAADSVATGDAVVIQVIDRDDPFKGETYCRQFIEPQLFICNSNDAACGENFNGRHRDVRIKGRIIHKLSRVGHAGLR